MTDEKPQQVDAQSTPSGDERGYLVRQDTKQIGIVLTVLTIITLVGHPIISALLSSYSKGQKDAIQEARINVAIIALEKHILKAEPILDDYRETKARWTEQIQNLSETLDELRDEIRMNRVATVRELKKRIPLKEDKPK